VQQVAYPRFAEVQQVAPRRAAATA